MKKTIIQRMIMKTVVINELLDDLVEDSLVIGDPEFNEIYNNIRNAQANVRDAGSKALQMISGTKAETNPRLNISTRIRMILDQLRNATDIYQSIIKEDENGNRDLDDLFDDADIAIGDLFTSACHISEEAQ